MGHPVLSLPPLSSGTSDRYPWRTGCVSRNLMQAEERRREEDPSSHDFPLMYPSRGQDLREETNRQEAQVLILSSGLCCEDIIDRRCSGTKGFFPWLQRLSAKSLGRQPGLCRQAPSFFSSDNFSPSAPPLPPFFLPKWNNGRERREREGTFFEAKGGTAASQRLPACLLARRRLQCIKEGV